MHLHFDDNEIYDEVRWMREAGFSDEAIRGRIGLMEQIEKLMEESLQTRRNEA